MASSCSSSLSRRYDVFPSFSGEDVRKSFLSHLLKELDRKSINTFIDHGIERSRPIGPELISAIGESRISIVVFSKNYASSTWCLNELVEIHKCYMELAQMVIPVFYKVDPSEVRKQTGEFGKAFEKTCKGKAEDQKQRWMQALAEVANMAGEDLGNWYIFQNLCVCFLFIIISDQEFLCIDLKGCSLMTEYLTVVIRPNEADMIGKIADDVSKKLITRKANSFGDFVGIEDHLEAMNSKLCLESEEARMVGIVGPSGIGKSTIGRAYFSELSSQFHFRAFVAYKRTKQSDYDMKLCWEEQFLSEILGQKDLKIYQLGEVERRLKHKKVLIVLDDVDDLELLNTLVGQTGWFGSGSRIIVITQDRQLLKAHEIYLVYEVEFPSEDLALKMLCRSAFRQNSPPDGFLKLLAEVTRLAGNLPLGLSVLGSSLRGRDEEEWMEMLPRLQNNLDGKIEKTLRVGYDGLDGEDKDLFLYIACLFNGKQVDEIKNLLGDSVNNIGFKLLAEKSLIRISPYGTVEMHSLLQKVGREIAREEYMDNPEKRRFLVDAKDIIKVLTNNIGTKNVLGIHFNTSDIEGPIFLDENSFEGMPNLQFLQVFAHQISRWPESGDRLNLPQGLVYLPPGLRLLSWSEYPSKCLPFTFKAEFLVEISMKHSKIEKLWDGTQPIGSLKKMDLSFSRDLKEIPDLSNAINLDKLLFWECKSLVSLPPSIQNLINLSILDLQGCESLVSLPHSIQNLTKLESLDLEGCKSLVTLPHSIQNLTKLEILIIRDCRKLEFFPILPVSMEYLELLDFTGCPRIINFPQIKMWYKVMEDESLVDVRDSLWIDEHSGFDCLGSLLKCLPGKFGPKHLAKLAVESKTLRKLWEGPQSFGSLKELNLSGCVNLIELPDLSKTINLEILQLDNCKSLVTVPCTIGNLNKLVKLEMRECIMLEALPTDVSLSSLETLDLTGCSSLRIFPQISRSVQSLYLRGTAIEQVPCSIENFSRLSVLMMRGCERLKNVSPNIFKRLVKMDFSDCGEVTAMSDAIVVATMSMEDHFPPPISSYGGSIWEYVYCNFNNCFKLDGHARELILRSYYSATVLPGGEVPTYFTHQASGYSLTVTVPQSSLSQEFLGFKTCLVVDHGTDWFWEAFPFLLGVRWYFRGRRGMHKVRLNPRKMDHLVMFHFGLPLRELSDPPPDLGYESDPPPDLGYNHVKFEFFHHTYDCCHFAERKPCPLSFQRIKGCGVRVMNVSPSACGATISSESEYNQQSVENCYVETGRSKKRMRMTVRESEESSNISCGQIVENTGLTAPNLELSLGQGEASAQVSSRSNKIPSSSVSSSNFHGEGALLCLSLSPSYPSLEGEALCVDPMITEQQDTETTIVDHSLSPQLINFIR